MCKAEVHGKNRRARACQAEHTTDCRPIACLDGPTWLQAYHKHGLDDSWLKALKTKRPVRMALSG